MADAISLTRDEKVYTLRELTRGADDVFALRGNTGWQPVYGPLRDEHVVMHLSGSAEIGSYMLLPPEPGQLPNVWSVSADFDGKKCKRCKRDNIAGRTHCENCETALPDWRLDVQRAVEFVSSSGATLLVNLSRSMQGAHVRALFKEPVPAWMARRWMTAWLDEAEVTEVAERDVPTSFDRLIPPQDMLPPGINPLTDYRYIGNLIGSPLHGGIGRRTGGTLPIDPNAAMNGDFEVDGLHWHYATDAVRRRSWGRVELEAALADAPGASPRDARFKPPAHVREARPLTVINDNAPLDFTIRFCAFMDMMNRPGVQPYALWVALATHLHRFGENGRQAWHEISSRDPRYRYHDAERKWQQTETMHPVRCETLAAWGWSCPHLDAPRCAGAWNPAVFYDCTKPDLL